MRISELLANSASLIGKEIEVTGFLSGNILEGFLQEDDSDFAHVRVAVPYPEVKDAMLEAACFYVGGNRLFADECRAIGTLVMTPTQQLEFRPSRLDILKDGDAVTVHVTVNTNG